MKMEKELKEYGNLTEAQLEQAMQYQEKHRGMRLGAALVELGMISERRLLEILATCMQLDLVHAGQMKLDLEAVKAIPMEMARRYRILGTSVDGDTLTVLTNDPLNYYGLEDVRQTTGKNLSIFLCEGAELDHAIRCSYAELHARQAASAVKEIGKPEEETLELEAGDGDTPVIHLLNSLIERAYHQNASDIHLEPFEDKTVVRMRIDGTILEYVTIPRRVHASLIARIKILSDLDIAKRQIPQDGHCRVKLEGKTVHMRVSVMPTVFGEKAVIRLLSGNMRMDYAGTFGMYGEVYETVKRMLEMPHGLIYITGPTGSGKTTTLYLILQELAGRHANIVTIEDPVERNLPGINQSQVNPAAGLTFETGLRALLRQDPDIIMVGETRDRETASIAVRAAVTGHLVFSTLHTNDALSAIVRLKDMGVEPYLAAASLTGLVAQRLVRKLCPRCAREAEPDARTRAELGLSVNRIRVPVGCPYCHQTGYQGRIAIHEAVLVDRKLREMIAADTRMETIRAYAKQELHMRTLRENGAELVAQGITSVEEWRRAAAYESV